MYAAHGCFFYGRARFVRNTPAHHTVYVSTKREKNNRQRHYTKVSLAAFPKLWSSADAPWTRRWYVYYTCLNMETVEINNPNAVSYVFEITRIVEKQKSQETL